MKDAAWPACAVKKRSCHIWDRPGASINIVNQYSIASTASSLLKKIEKQHHALRCKK